MCLALFTCQASTAAGVTYSSVRQVIYHSTGDSYDNVVVLDDDPWDGLLVSDLDGVLFESTKQLDIAPSPLRPDSQDLRVAMTTRVEGVIPPVSETWNPMTANLTLSERTDLRLALGAEFNAMLTVGHVSASLSVISLDDFLPVASLHVRPRTGAIGSSSDRASEVVRLPPGEYDVFITLEDWAMISIFADRPGLRFATAEASITIIPTPGTIAAFLGLLAAPRCRR